MLGKNCLGGLTWLESAGIFLPQQDFPGWGFVSGNSLVSRCLVASYLGGVSWVEVPCSAPAASWNSLFDSFLEFKGFAGLPLSAEKFPRWSFWVGYPGWQFFPFLCVGEKLPRWTYLARKCWNLSSSARLTWVEFCEWKFLSFPLCGCKLIRWSFLGGSSLQCSCSFLEFPVWNLRDLLACLFLQRNFLGGVSWVGYPGWQFLAFLCLGEKLPRWTYLARNCWSLSSSARLSWVDFCEWKFLSFPLSGCQLIRWSFLGGSSLQCSCCFLEFPF